MTYYIVKVTSKATKDNPNFADMTSIAYYGEDQKLLGREGSVHDCLGGFLQSHPIHTNVDVMQLVLGSTGMFVLPYLGMHKLRLLQLKFDWRSMLCKNG